jgi:hypothetical protein
MLNLRPTVVCVCIEQTFTEESAVGDALGAAFSAALQVFSGSTMETEMNNYIRQLAGSIRGDEEEWFMSHLILRMAEGLLPRKMNDRELKKQKDRNLYFEKLCEIIKAHRLRK